MPSTNLSIRLAGFHAILDLHFAPDLPLSIVELIPVDTTVWKIVRLRFSRVDVPAVTLCDPHSGEVEISVPAQHAPNVRFFLDNHAESTLDVVFDGTRQLPCPVSRFQFDRFAGAGPRV